MRQQNPEVYLPEALTSAASQLENTSFRLYKLANALEDGTDVPPARSAALMALVGTSRTVTELINAINLLTLDIESSGETESGGDKEP